MSSQHFARKHRLVMERRGIHHLPHLRSVHGLVFHLPGKRHLGCAIAQIHQVIPLAKEGRVSTAIGDFPRRVKKMMFGLPSPMSTRSNDPIWRAHSASLAFLVWLAQCCQRRESPAARRVCLVLGRASQSHPPRRRYWMKVRL
jgi:hypothetical protein